MNSTSYQYRNTLATREAHSVSIGMSTVYWKKNRLSITVLHFKNVSLRILFVRIKMVLSKTVISMLAISIKETKFNQFIET